MGKISFGSTKDTDVNLNDWAGCCNPVYDAGKGTKQRGGIRDRSQPRVQPLCLEWTAEMRGLARFWDLEVSQGLRGEAKSKEVATRSQSDTQRDLSMLAAGL